MKLKTDNPFFRWMGKLGDMVLLDLLWLLCCFPLVTLGASTTALFYVARKLAAGEEYHIVHDFFHSFRQNWKQATVVWLAMLAAGAVFLADLVIGLQTPGASGSLFRGIGGVLCVLWLMVFTYVFPLLARYEYTVGQLFSNALYLGVRNLMITITGIVLIGWFPLLVWGSVEVAVYVFPFWMLVGGGVSALILSTLMLPVFHKLEQKKEEQ